MNIFPKQYTYLLILCYNFYINRKKYIINYKMRNDKIREEDK